MNINENAIPGTAPDAHEGVVELGVASVETQGNPGFPTEGSDLGIVPGISEE